MLEKKTWRQILAGQAYRCRHLLIMLAYCIFYLISFHLLERLPVRVNLIGTIYDEMIPFCAPFCIFYLSWFGYITVTILYYALRPGRLDSFKKLGMSFAAGMTFFLLLSLLYPNGHQLRPELTGGGFFERLVALIYSVDTPTNVLPSLHVFCSTACAIAWFTDPQIRHKRRVRCLTGFLTVMIVLSTLLIKQHTILDVVLALLCNTVCFQLFYRILPERESTLRKLFLPGKVLTGANGMSLLRIILAVSVLAVDVRYDGAMKYQLVCVLVIAMLLTDFLDGCLARAFKKSSELGAILDTIADRASQGAMLLYLCPRFSIARPVLVIFLVKTLIVILTELLAGTLQPISAAIGEKWYGKPNNVVFYGILAILVLDRTFSHLSGTLLLMMSACSMIFSACLYLTRCSEVLGMKKA